MKWRGLGPPIKWVVITSAQLLVAPFYWTLLGIQWMWRGTRDPDACPYQGVLSCYKPKSTGCSYGYCRRHCSESLHHILRIHS